MPKWIYVIYGDHDWNEMTPSLELLLHGIIIKNINNNPVIFILYLH